MAHSPKTPTKRVNRRVKTTKDYPCLLCGVNLLGLKCTFNLRSNTHLLHITETLLENNINLDVQSERMCKPCANRVESLYKRNRVVLAQIEDIKSKYDNASGIPSASPPKTPPESRTRVKRQNKSSPMVRKRTKKALFPVGMDEILVDKELSRVAPYEDDTESLLELELEIEIDNEMNKPTEFTEQVSLF